MSAHKSPSFVNPKSSNLRSPRARISAPGSDNMLPMQRREDSSLSKLWRLTHALIKVRYEALLGKDVKNEGRSGYVYENT